MELVVCMVGDCAPLSGDLSFGRCFDMAFSRSRTLLQFWSVMVEPEYLVVDWETGGEYLDVLLWLVWGRVTGGEGELICT